MIHWFEGQWKLCMTVTTVETSPQFSVFSVFFQVESPYFPAC
jgi:hypothetical protein